MKEEEGSLKGKEEGRKEKGKVEKKSRGFLNLLVYLKYLEVIFV